jgi:hypothetical protein
VWLLSALSLRAGCWFALVEASFLRCVFLASVLAVLMVIFMLLIGSVDVLAVEAGWPASVPVIAAFSLAAINIFLSLATAKWFLQCKWRSAITVFVMAQFFLQVVFFVVGTIVVVVPSLDALREAVLPAA